MGATLDDDGGRDAPQVALFLEAVDDDGAFVGQLLAQQAKELLADDLGREEALGTVGELVLAVDGLPFRQVGLDGIKQRLDALPVAGADRHDGSQTGMRLMDLGDQRQHFVDVAQLVDLVERNDDRRVALEPAQDLLVLSPPAPGLGDEYHHIGLLSHRLGRAVEDLVERVDALGLIAR